jgi:hypothetical protein
VIGIQRLATRRTVRGLDPHLAQGTPVTIILGGLYPYLFPSYLLGISILIAGTSYELYEACQSIKDLDILYADMDMGEEIPGDVLRSVCNPIIPDAGKVWGDVKAKSSEWWDIFISSLWE